MLLAGDLLFDSIESFYLNRGDRGSIPMKRLKFLVFFIVSMQGDAPLLKIISWSQLLAVLF